MVVSTSDCVRGREGEEGRGMGAVGRDRSGGNGFGGGGSGLGREGLREGDCAGEGGRARGGDRQGGGRGEVAAAIDLMCCLNLSVSFPLYVWVLVLYPHPPMSHPLPPPPVHQVDMGMAACTPVLLDPARGFPMN